MIVRIATETQYRLDDGVAERLNELDNAVVDAVEAGDEARFADLFTQMLDLVRAEGRPLPEDDLEPSDVILPPPGTTFEEAAAEFTGEGLIPD